MPVPASDPSELLPSPAFWSGKRVLLTGHSGFKGSWLALWLQQLGAKVVGLALPPESDPSLFQAAQVAQALDGHWVDVRDEAAVRAAVQAADPEVVLHLAAQALVRRSYEQPVATFASNVLGTVHLLDALRTAEHLRAVVVVTTDKVYENREWPHPYREADALGGHDPYSASKAACELATASYRSAYFAGRGVAVATARAGNVIGGGDFSADRLLPDALAAWLERKPLAIRRPEARRPWQHVLEPLCGYLRLAERLAADAGAAGAWNFGPEPRDALSVRQVVQRAQLALQAMEPGLPAEVLWGDGEQGPHEAGWLALDNSKARVGLALQPRWSVDTAIERTLQWHLRWQRGESARELCLRDVQAFSAGEEAP